MKALLSMIIEQRKKLYAEHTKYLKKNKLAIESKKLCKIKKPNIALRKGGTESSGILRKTFRKGVRLTEKYSQPIDSEQHISDLILLFCNKTSYYSNFFIK
jgi:hypothetical protein